ncbi:MAG TPA: SGNH/GDSL hydrolase family protein [Cyclobacteriaceae bacterium]|nr:SGNH/GDSL hydrolase family protein [Cyclobacteriaceae bacterium]
MKFIKLFSKRSVLLLYLFQFILVALIAQDPRRFEKEIHDLVAGDSTISKRKLILFTGSSSIRFWSGLRKDFPNHNVLNRGFGGSEMSDLLYYAEPLILNYNPKEIFIYEGDNDINSGKSPEEILANADKLLSLLRAHLPAKVKIIFISAKPSIARWHLKERYEEFNRQLKAWTSTKKNVLYADVWTPMLDSSGAVRKDLFIEDNLHMNQVGYGIWATAIRKFM